MVAGKTLWPTLFYPKQVIKFPMRKVPFLQQEVQFSSVAQLCPTLCNPINRSTPGLPVHQVGDAIQPTHPLSSPSPPALNLSQHQGLFKWVSSWIRWPKFWSFSFNISPSNEHPGLISFRMDWLDLPAIQQTFKSLLQHHSSKASILQHSAFFIVQLSHPYMTTGKTIALTRRTFVDKVREHPYHQRLGVDTDMDLYRFTKIILISH